ncbi:MULTISPECIES: hypothetical protein [Nostocales]|jgi:ABC-type Fe3+-hydroxamate transport system substrate-binding protein|uniref:Uncharacterized protein n=1 Tax=Dolichospermum flos-aquae UHCC 0037 TaxID=2590026 RepID=A0ACC7SAK5_DOLFA|nr:MULTISPECIES: hypothetical protein [Nostocales]MBO1063218.1 hypothetical protein [Anabaena sp. 54]MTJ45545.1 hypothetical protein [Dolichospermum flos-aquae UHCC 0037]
MTSKIIQQRSQIWQKYDEAGKQQKELASYSSQFSSAGVVPDMSFLTATKTPPDEVAASIREIKQEVDKIKKAESSIEQYQAEIAATKKQFFIVVGVAAFVVVVILFMLLKR